jgi:hypothetical protein
MHYLQVSASIVKKAATGFGQNADHVSSIQTGSTPKKPTKRVTRQLP